MLGRIHNIPSLTNVGGCFQTMSASSADFRLQPGSACRFFHFIRPRLKTALQTEIDHVVYCIVVNFDLLGPKHSFQRRVQDGVGETTGQAWADSVFLYPPVL